MAFGYIGHILWRDRNQSFHPEDPLVVDNGLGADVKFTFIDVIPGVLKKPPAGFPAKRESIAYHSFSALVAACNEWLAKNTDWEVINCETILLFFKFEDNGWQLAPQDTCFHLDGDAHSSLMALRLWIKRRDIDVINGGTNGNELGGNEANVANSSSETTHQTICYADFKPEKDDDDDTTRFEKLETVIDRANKSIREGNVKGTPITIETLYFPANSDWEIDPEATLHVFPGKCVSIIRLFYISGADNCTEQIGIRDFTPKLLTGGGLFKKPSFENLSGTMSRASDWLANNGSLEFKNAQCLEIKVKNYKHIETNSMSHSSDRGDYLRIFRVAYTKRPTDSVQDTPDSLRPDDSNTFSPRSIFLSSVIFTPADRETSLTQIKRKLHDWVDKAIKDIRFEGANPGSQKPRLLSAETVEIFCRQFSEEDIKGETENTFQYNRIGTINCFLFMAFRVYFDVGQVGRTFRSRSVASTASRKTDSCKVL
ncbi:uncharacterized protein LOC107367203 [Tetranychus urticae]|uniref:uncharacterized protein LOC107367203 n=1 Tax=Tetranychus urticae TaxID=32264 RepID=UPI00077BDEB2|nr:uncharacterized protein LOC107367203 [Tetranychus urticae]